MSAPELWPDRLERCRHPAVPETPCTDEVIVPVGSQPEVDDASAFSLRTRLSISRSTLQ